MFFSDGTNSTGKVGGETLSKTCDGMQS